LVRSINAIVYITNATGMMRTQREEVWLAAMWLTLSSSPVS
jgi:hypothetical protein